MRLTDHFSVDELIRNSGAHAVPDEVLLKAQHTAEVMEAIRSTLGDRVIDVGSWYRTPAKNQQVKGAAGSAHLSGYGVDFNVRGLSPRQVLTALQSVAGSLPSFDRVIDERDHVHLTAAPTNNKLFLVEPQEGKYESFTKPLAPVVVTAPAPAGNAKAIAIITALVTILGAIAKYLSDGK